ncbi:hypothetical protein JK635_08245 [Neobacillus sp. YIM B02564]|uniref:Uncharacterized protein n=1 Tax=Neobacillus paridis TaxID=2803862 RepID=A0ABS1TNQ1_9BACI|nr:hypothetical protein [Neobacillus paridis]MBL4952198.1 hypothetical protein [Neobacillus paridis]
MNKVDLFTVNRDVRCLKCGNRGAVKFYGRYYPRGVGEKADTIKSYEPYRKKPYMSPAVGFGGTIPHECLNCGNRGLIDFGGLEGYKKAFTTIKE